MPRSSLCRIDSGRFPCDNSATAIACSSRGNIVPELLGIAVRESSTIPFWSEHAEGRSIEALRHVVPPNTAVERPRDHVSSAPHACIMKWRTCGAPASTYHGPLQLLVRRLAQR